MGSVNLSRVVAVLEADPASKGTVIGYYGGNMCRVLSNGDPTSAHFGSFIFVVEETRNAAGAHVVGSGPGSVEESEGGGALASNGSQLQAELVGAFLNCSFTVLAGIGVLGSAALEIPTAGAATVVMVAAWTGFATSGLQCLNGVVRAVVAANYSTGTGLAEWDDGRYYPGFFFVVDALGVASSVVSLPHAIRNLMAILERRGGLVALEQLIGPRGGNRFDRAKAIKAAMQRASRDPGTRKELEKALKNVGYRGYPGLSVPAARKAAAAITKETARRLQRAIADIVGNVGGPIASATPQRWTGSASGSVNTIGGLFGRGAGWGAEKTGLIIHAIPVDPSQ